MFINAYNVHMQTKSFVGWYGIARNIGNRLVIITGSEGLKDTIPMVGSDFIDRAGISSGLKLTRLILQLRKSALPKRRNSRG